MGVKALVNVRQDPVTVLPEILCLLIFLSFGKRHISASISKKNFSPKGTVILVHNFLLCLQCPNTIGTLYILTHILALHLWVQDAIFHYHIGAAMHLTPINKSINSSSPNSIPTQKQSNLAKSFPSLKNITCSVLQHRLHIHI